MIDWSLVLSIVVAIVALGVLAGMVYLVTKTAVLASGCILTILGLSVIIAIFIDALAGWPIGRRIGWLILSLADLLYSATLAALQPVPALPHPVIP